MDAVAEQGLSTNIQALRHEDSFLLRSLKPRRWRPFPPTLPGQSETSDFCNHFHKNRLPATVELLATGLIGSLYLLYFNCPRKTRDTARL